MKAVQFFRWSAAGLTLAAFAASLTLSAAAVNTTLPPKKTEHKTRAYWQISAVDTSGSTVTLAKSDLSSNLTVRVTAATRITVNGKTAKLDDLKEDMKVTVSISGTSCSQIAATSATTDDKKKKK